MGMRGRQTASETEERCSLRDPADDQPCQWRGCQLENLACDAHPHRDTELFEAWAVV